MVADPQNRDEKGRFKLGNVANPGGRPAVARDFKARCRDFMEKTGWHNIETIAKDPSHQHFMRATEILAAYAYGKPSQAVEHAGTVNLNVRYDNPQPGHSPSDSTL